MAETGDWYYCMKHHEVEHAEGCRALDRLGPYPSQEAAAHALEQVQQRNKAADEADREWDGDY